MLFFFIFSEIKKTIKNDIDKDGINSNKKYRECEINFENFQKDLNEKKEDLNFQDLEIIFKDLKSLFEKNFICFGFWKFCEIWSH